MTLLKHTMTILLAPITTWRVIAAESITPLRLYLIVIIPLSAIVPLAERVRLAEELSSHAWTKEEFILFLGPVDSWRYTPIGISLNYVWPLIEIYALALLTNLLAPLFSGERNLNQALKVMAFSFAPIWIGSIFIAVPGFSLDKSMITLSLVYTVCLLYLGLSVLMKSSFPSALFYTGLIIAAHFGMSSLRRETIPAIMNFPRQWPILHHDLKILLGLLFLLAIVAVAIFLFYGKHRKTT